MRDCLLIRTLCHFVLFAGAISAASKDVFDTSLPTDVLSINPGLSNGTEYVDNDLRLQGRWNGPVPPRSNDATWERFKCKGRKLLYQMQLSDADAASILPEPQTTLQSPWSYGWLAPWGYKVVSSTPNYRNLESDGTWGVANFFRSLGIDTKFEQEGGKWKGLSILHHSASVIPNYETHDPAQMKGYTDPYGKYRRSSGAYHALSVLPQGFIMVQNTMGPRAAADKYFTSKFPDSELPDLKRLSDMVWIAWSYMPQPTWVQYLLSLSINNRQTNELIARALNGVPITAQPKEYAVESDEGLALLASPNGASFAHFLIERKNQVGHKYINKIWVWESETPHKAPILMFGVIPVTVPAVLPDPQTGPQKRQNPPLASGFDDFRKRSVVRKHTFRVDGNMTASEV